MTYTGRAGQLPFIKDLSISGVWDGIKAINIENSVEIFASGRGLVPDRESEIKVLQAKIGEITMENDFLSKVPDR